ncbi:ATP synthase F1 subunit gamma [Marinoscillum furvescens]|uniref:ATP synthase gamma chain n=1 Tax=Marinoscillum furvescens DSM 4134 TaxID=1122208 RepID=A0A3D9L6H9_MARFU|nr:ATP synthase F1 subunit gamma [Marinoscillum furvescens]REE00510.1 ATP synthase F1 subcomplex gamma subunit [Marinoscillum furvescens DSM 4134]
MANLKEVKGRIQSVTSTQQITKAMKMVAAAKLRRAQDRITQMRPYSQKLSSIIGNVSAGVDSEQIDNPYAEVRDTQKVLLVVVTSDRGLCGAFNSSIFKKAKAVIAEKYADVEAAGNLFIMPVGKKGYDHFSKRGYNIVDTYAELFSDLNFETAMEAAEFAMESFVEGVYDQVEIVYNEFKNVATQIAVAEQFLPIQNDSAEEQEEESTNNASEDYIYEPNQAFIFSEIVPKSLKIQFYKTLLESNASEQGARMTAMDQATDNAGELLKELRLTYNRTRQAAITKEILEIVGGAEALAQGG